MLNSLFKNILGKYTKSTVMSELLQQDMLLSVDLKSPDNQVNDKLVIGFLAKLKASQLFDVSVHKGAVANGKRLSQKIQ